MGNFSMCQINLSCSFSHEKSPWCLVDFGAHTHLLDCFLLRLISWKAQSTGTNSEQESLIWKQFLIKNQQNMLRLPITTEKQLIAWLVV